MQGTKKVSIIIPTFNEAANISKCLQAIAANNYPHNLIEVVVVDGGSKDDTINIIKSFSKNDIEYIVIEAPNTSVYTALNIGLKKSTGEYIVRVDARSIIPGNYISTCIKHIEEDKVTVAGGVQLQYGEDIFQKTIASVLQSKFGTGNAKFRTGNYSGLVDTVYLGVFKKEVFNEVGVYDDDGIVVSEDSMMNDRIRSKGGKIYLDGSLIVKYPAKKNITELARQYFIYGGAKAHTFTKYKKLTAARQYIILGVFLTTTIVLAFTFAGLLPWQFATGFIAFYFLLDVINAAFIKTKNENEFLFLYALVVYPSIHISWALGFFCRYVFGKKFAPIFFQTKKKNTK